jgi:cell division protein FtsQ
MAEKRTYTFKKFIAVAIWIILGSVTVLLLVAAIDRKNNDHIARVDIHISGVQNNYFIDKKDVLAILQKTNGQKLENTNADKLNLSQMENALSKQPWVKNAEMFFDNNNVLQVKITEREPIARIFTVSGASFYIDSSLARLPLSSKFSARLPVFTSFPTDVKVLTKSDSSLLSDVKMMSEFINAHPFWMAQIDQVDITSARTFELTPKLGNQLIRFGGAGNCEQKFNKLLAFYK